MYGSTTGAMPPHHVRYGGSSYQPQMAMQEPYNGAQSHGGSSHSMHGGHLNYQSGMHGHNSNHPNLQSNPSMPPTAGHDKKQSSQSELNQRRQAAFQFFNDLANTTFGNTMEKFNNLSYLKDTERILQTLTNTIYLEAKNQSKIVINNSN